MSTRPPDPTPRVWKQMCSVCVQVLLLLMLLCVAMHVPFFRACTVCRGAAA
jgi:hypothetical protein